MGYTKKKKKKQATKQLLSISYINNKDSIYVFPIHEEDDHLY